MKTMMKTGLLAIATLACLHCGSADPSSDDQGQSEDGLINNGGLNADGDSCDIDRNGLKTPGTKKGTQCCNVFDAKDCVEIPTTPAPAPTRARGIGALPGGGTRTVAR